MSNFMSNDNATAVLTPYANAIKNKKDVILKRYQNTGGPSTSSWFRLFDIDFNSSASGICYMDMRMAVTCGRLNVAEVFIHITSQNHVPQISDSFIKVIPTYNTFSDCVTMYTENNLSVIGVAINTLGETAEFGFEIFEFSGDKITLSDISVDNPFVELSAKPTDFGTKAILSGAYSDLSGKPTLGTAAAKNVPASGDAASTEVVMGDDSRLTDARNAADVSAWAKASTKPTYTASEVGAIASTEKGANNGVAELDSAGKVLSSQLPSYVDDVLEYASTSYFPVTGESGKIYIAIDTNLSYRWTGSGYAEISPSLALGETSSTAYRGDRGKAAYDHSQLASGNPHNVTASEVGLGNVPNVTTDNQTPTVTEASTRANLASGDTLKTIIGKIKKYFTDLKTVAFTGSYNDLTNKPTIVSSASFSDLDANGEKIGTFNVTVGGGSAVQDINIPLLAEGTGIDIVADASNNTKTISVDNKYVVSTVASQGLTDTEKSNARTNIESAISKQIVDQDLNLVTTPGFYNAGGGNTCTNKPTGIDAFGLEVIKAASGSYYLQRLTGSNSTTTYRRKCNNGTWGSWIEEKITDTNNRKSFYGTCDTAAATADKVVTLADTTGWELKAGTIVGVKYTYSNSASNVTLNINGTGAKSIYYNNSAYTGTWNAITGAANCAAYYMYDGTYWRWVSGGYVSDTSVGQNNTTTNSDYRVLFSYNANDTTETQSARKNTNLRYNPSTGNLQTTQLNGVTVGSSPKFTDTNNRKAFYGTCSTAAATAAKEVTLSDTTGWELKAGTIVGVKFTNTNTATNCTININGTGAKNVYYGTGVNSDTNYAFGSANRISYFMYDGTYWVWMSYSSIVNDSTWQENTTNNLDYRVLLSGGANDTSQISGAKKNTNLKYNPSTQNLMVPKINGVSTVYTSAVSAAVGDTTCTITNAAITTTSIIEEFCENTSGTKIAVTQVDVTTGQAVLHFAALTEATSFKLRITNI